MLHKVFFAAAGVLALAALPVANPARAQYVEPKAPPEFSDYIAALQGEWVSRFCDHRFSWKVTDRTVTMLKHSPPGSPGASYDNRHPEGARIMIIGEIVRQTPNMVQFGIQRVEPNGRVSSPGERNAITYTPVMEGVKVRYFTFNSDMWRPETRARYCK